MSQFLKLLEMHVFSIVRYSFWMEEGSSLGSLRVKRISLTWGAWLLVAFLSSIASIKSFFSASASDT